jgi:hypothetical protein
LTIRLIAENPSADSAMNPAARERMSLYDAEDAGAVT